MGYSFEGDRKVFAIGGERKASKIARPLRDMDLTLATENGGHKNHREDLSYTPSCQNKDA